MTPREKLAAGRLMAAEKMPYFRVALWSMIPHECKGLGTYGITENGILLWDPDKTLAWSVDEVADTLLHEVGHLLRDHAKRCKTAGFDTARWNLAGDMEINDDLKAAGLCKQGEWVFPKDVGADDGKLAEEYYHLIKPQPGGGTGDGKNGKGAKGAQIPGAPKAGMGWCGSGAGRKLEQEPEGQQAQGRSEADIARIRRQVADEIRKESEKGRGTIPGGWSRWADQFLQPAVIPWQNKLARYARQAVAEKAGVTDFSYRKPSRRQSGLGFGPGTAILPTMRGNKPNVLVAVDTSGSMGEDDLRDAMVEVNGIIKATGGSIQFMSCDAMVHASGKVMNLNQAGKLVKGGGGTDFNPVFEAAARLPEKPSVLVFLTDGCGPAPASPPPRMGVIWVLIGGYKHRPTTWGDYVEVPRTEKAARR